MRCAIYARVSTKDKGQETDNQLLALREFAAKQGWKIVEEFVDHESGATNERPQFQRMFQAASQRKFDVLLFWSLDRLSREGVLETLQHLNRLTSYGVGYRSFTEQYFDSCGIFKDAVISILATVAKQERIRISERVKAGQSRARLQGKRIGRPKSTVSVSEIAKLRAEGLSYQAIADKSGVSIATAFNLLKQSGLSGNRTNQ
jgi:DNA invertase Pin-like site-specific DNA recombinase